MCMRFCKMKQKSKQQKSKQCQGHTHWNNTTTAACTACGIYYILICQMKKGQRIKLPVSTQVSAVEMNTMSACTKQYTKSCLCIYIFSLSCFLLAISFAGADLSLWFSYYFFFFLSLLRSICTRVCNVCLHCTFILSVRCMCLPVYVSVWVQCLTRNMKDFCIKYFYWNFIT